MWRELASSSSTIVQKEIGRVWVIDWLIELNVYSRELIETNLRRRNFSAGSGGREAWTQQVGESGGLCRAWALEGEM